MADDKAESLDTILGRALVQRRWAKATPEQRLEQGRRLTEGRRRAALRRKRRRARPKPT